MTTESAIAAWKRNLAARNVSESTQAYYLRLVEQFAAWMEKQPEGKRVKGA